MRAGQTSVCLFVLATFALPAQTADAIISKRCLSCHNNQLDNAGLSFEKQDTVAPRTGKILAAITHKGDVKMPPGSKLPDSEIAALTRWVRNGAKVANQAVSAAETSRQFPFELWTFDRLDSIAGYATKVEGHPRVVDSPVGRAVEFNGVDDALFIEAHPLVEAAQFTWEVIFRPDADGRPEQRFFHLQERDPASGGDTANRFLFEIRLKGGQWFVDSFVMSPAGSKALLNSDHPHPAGQWYHVAQVYDGKEYRNYVNGVRENQAPMTFTPNRAGHASAGVRINRRDYFKGAIAQSRFTRGALTPAEFLKLPLARDK